MERNKKIYLIQHGKTKKNYIGSAFDVGHRFSHHLSALQTQRHSVEDLQKDFDTYGNDLRLIILAEVPEKEVLYHEHKWQRLFKSDVRGVGYNYKDPWTNEQTALYCKEKNDLIDKISFLMTETHDIGLLDLIHNLLQRSKR